MKIVAVLLVALAILIAVVPQFTDCESQGRTLMLANGKTAPMKCHWTAQAALAISPLILVVGALLAVNRRKDVAGNLGIVATGLGMVTIALPTTLIGVCANPDMLCNSIMSPALVLMGTLVSALGLVTVALSRKQRELVA